MWPFPKKLFEWKEPWAFRETLSKVKAKKAGWWAKPAAALLCAGLFLLQCLLAKWDPNKNRAPFGTALLIAVGLGLFVYVVTWIPLELPAYVMVYETGICRVVGSANRVWKLADIAAYSWRDCDEFDLLVLEHRKGQILIGVPRRVSRAELEAFFAVRGLEKLHVSSDTVSLLSASSPIASSKT